MKWAVGNAATEFEVDRSTLSKRLKHADAKPDGDGKFSTAQICAAMFGDYGSHRARKMAADADTAEDERDKSRRKLMDADQVMRAWESIILPAKQRLQSIPSKVQSRLSLTPEQAKVVTQEIDEALLEISKQPDYDQNAAESEDADADRA